MKDHPRGFSIIELMLVVAIIMIVASLIMPNLINALHKTKQKKTMAELSNVGKAWMSWLTDQAGATSAGAQKSYDVTGFIELDYVDLFDHLHPSETFFYMQEIPQRDAWGSLMSFWRNPNLRSDKVMVICAAARDNIFDTCDGRTELPVGPFMRTDFDSDIIWADGGLLRFPISK